ncbi:hypothetical protein [Streptomyces sp. NPDC059278]|uniref:hypothetical protein n=1 Tax=Streptomyces sp. NPDC059278 TaxID=3346801 RepID=UPI0036A8AE04
MTQTEQTVRPLDVDKGNLLPGQYTGGLHTFVMVDATMETVAEGAVFSDGRAVLSRNGGAIEDRYSNINSLVEEWFGVGAVLWVNPDTEAPRPRRFIFRRGADTTGFSGTGIAVEGVQFTHGGVRLMWLGQVRSLVEWSSIEEAITVHGHAGDTVIEWLDAA